MVVDGQTEQWYFRMIARNHPNLGVRVKPELAVKAPLEKQFLHVQGLIGEGYDKVFWVVDLDVILKETRQKNESNQRNPTKKPKELTIDEFQRYYSQLKEAHSSKVEIIVNNPCLEFWLLLHYSIPTDVFSNSGNATDAIISHLPDYEKTRDYYTKQGNDMYLRLKSMLPRAMENAQSLGDFNITNPEANKSGMPLFFHSAQFVHIFKKV